MKATTHTVEPHLTPKLSGVYPEITNYEKP